LLCGPPGRTRIGVRHAAGALQLQRQERIGLGSWRPLIPVQTHDPHAVMVRAKISHAADDLNSGQLHGLAAVAQTGCHPSQLGQGGRLTQGWQHRIKRRQFRQ
jgi:hypothetical protein